MTPLIIQIVAWIGFWFAGVTGLLPTAGTPVGALRFALAVMFGFTALSHFLPRTRADLVRMVPPVFPAPALLVSLTGLLELAGAIGLLLPGLTALAALALTALLCSALPSEHPRGARRARNRWAGGYAAPFSSAAAAVLDRMPALGGRDAPRFRLID